MHEPIGKKEFKSCESVQNKFSQLEKGTGQWILWKLKWNSLARWVLCLRMLKMNIILKGQFNKIKTNTYPVAVLI